MGVQNSHGEEEILHIVTETIADGYAVLRTQFDSVRQTDESRDIAYLSKRFEKEGIEFLTVALPRLGDWLDRLLRGEEVQRVDGFKPYDGLYPCFLRPFWSYLQAVGFKVTPETAATVRILRTFLHGCKKLDVPCAPEKIEARLQSFLDVESELEDFDPPASSLMLRAQLLVDEYLQGYEPRCESPQHGPGAVAGGEALNEKWDFSHIYESVEKEFPFLEYYFPVRSVVKPPSQCGAPLRAQPVQWAANVSHIRRLLANRVSEPTARLLLVPKDSRGPRVISCEPKELMYLQQGVSKHLVRFIERHGWTRGHVNFTDQSINAQLALRASETREWDTIDLTDASDRVSVRLIKMLYPQRVASKWLALRSTATKLPSGEVVALNKFAPMGSALCFPVEALTFWAIAVAAIEDRGVARHLALQYVYVYGDDIIVRTGYTTAVMEALESVCLRVNRSKSFIGEDPFRESCGIEAISGHDVTPLRLRKLPPSRPSDGTGLVAYAAYASLSWELMPRRASALLGCVERLVGPIPRVPCPQPFLSVVTPNDHWGPSDYQDVKWSPELCLLTAKVLCLKQRKTFSPLGEWSRLQLDLVSPARSDPSYVVERQSTQIRRKRGAILYYARG